MSQWTQIPAMDRFWDVRVVSDRNYIVTIFIYIILSLSSENLPIRMHRKKPAICGLCAYWDVSSTHLDLLNPKVSGDLTESTLKIILCGVLCTYLIKSWPETGSPYCTKNWSKTRKSHFNRLLHIPIGPKDFFECSSWHASEKCLLKTFFILWRLIRYFPILNANLKNTFQKPKTGLFIRNFGNAVQLISNYQKCADLFIFNLTIFNKLVLNLW